jgi:heme a synthase
MDTQPLYDLSPTLHLMIMSTLVALGPLSWLWLRNKRAEPARRLQALTLLVLFLTFDLVVFGAFTRLTDSGLGCPDWPGCYGSASPIGAHAEIAKAEAEMPTGPVTQSKAWIEMIHRYLAMAVGVLLITLTGATWLQRRQGAPVSTWWPAVTLIWVCIQGAFGALTVTMKLFPAIVTLHLLGGVVLLALLCRQAVAYSHAHDGRTAQPVPRATRTWLMIGLSLVWLQIALGGWVSTNYAVLACTDFPTCQGSWWPEMEFRQGFELWRELGKTSAGEYLAFAALTAIHYVHRLWAYVVLAVLGGLWWALRGSCVLRRQGQWIGALAALQLVTGLANVVLDWPISAAVLHTGGASALVIVLTWALCETRAARTAPAGLPSEGLSA